METLNVDPTNVLGYFVLTVIAVGLLVTVVGWLGLLVCQARERLMRKRKKTGMGATVTVDMGQAGSLLPGDYFEAPKPDKEE